MPVLLALWPGSWPLNQSEMALWKEKEAADERDGTDFIDSLESHCCLTRHTTHVSSMMPKLGF